MNRTTILTVLLFCVTLYIPLSCAQQSTDFQMDGTVLVKYHGSAAKVTIPKGVTAIGDGAFLFCIRLTGITIPSSVTAIGEGAFGGCTSLTSITIPAGVTAIGDWAFDGCKSLTSITIPSSVTVIGYGAFEGCDSLTSVTVSRKTTIGAGAFPDGVQITYSD